MFYVKQKISEDAEIRIDITDENVFAICPECGKDTEVWSRVVGYLRPVQNFHKGKKMEYDERLKYQIRESGL